MVSGIYQLNFSFLKKKKKKNETDAKKDWSLINSFYIITEPNIHRFSPYPFLLPEIPSLEEILFLLKICLACEASNYLSSFNQTRCHCLNFHTPTPLQFELCLWGKLHRQKKMRRALAAWTRPVSKSQLQGLLSTYLLRLALSSGYNTISIAAQSLHATFSSNYS